MLNAKKHRMKIQVKLFSIGLILCTAISCKESEKKNGYKEIDKYINEIFYDLVNIKRDLHMNPELSGQEKRTSEIVVDYLRDLGLEVKTNISGHAVIGILKGDKKGKKIAWRADMDAIRIKNNDTLKYHSQNKGIAHMCGHDVHTTIGLGIANVLSNQKENLTGTVYFIFQPSEETFTGAKDLVENGLFDIIEPDEIYGLHIDPAEKGTISTRAKELFAYQKAITIKLKRDGNEEEIESFLNTIIQEFVRNKPNSSPWSLDHLTDYQMGLENKETIYEDYFILQNTRLNKKDDFISFNANFLETDKEKLDSIPLQIKDKILVSKFKNSFISIEYSGGNPTVYNNPKLTETALQTINSFYSKELIKPIYGQIPYFNEDFIYYQQKIPGVMFLLGGSNMEKGTISMPHTPDFTVDDETIKFGVKCFSSLILIRTNSNNSLSTTPSKLH